MGEAGVIPVIRGQAGKHQQPFQLNARGRPLLHLSVCVENFTHVHHSYGAEVALASRDKICGFLRTIIQDGGTVSPGEAGVIQVCIRDMVLFGTGLTAKTLNQWLAELCRTLAMIPITTPAGTLHLWVSASWSVPEDVVIFDKGVPASWGRIGMGFFGAPVSDDATWAARYRVDMTKSAKVLAAITRPAMAGVAEHVRLAWQPIRDGRNWGEALYHEALLRLITPQGAAEAPLPVLEALERTGFIGLLDQYVAMQVVEELEAAPDVRLGVNMSALSLCSPALWDALVARLQGNPGVACRLFVEITETAAIPAMSEAIRFIDRLRGQGCQIVLDDFGMGHASVRRMMALAPDVVKIDKFFLQRGASGTDGRGMLEHLIGLAHSLRATVVVEGVETGEQARIGLEVGGVWQQGLHWGGPSLSRPWKMAASPDNAGGAINPALNMRAAVQTGRGPRANFGEVDV